MIKLFLTPKQSPNYFYILMMSYLNVVEHSKNKLVHVARTIPRLEEMHAFRLLINHKALNPEAFIMSENAPLCVIKELDTRDSFHCVKSRSP